METSCPTCGRDYERVLGFPIVTPPKAPGEKALRWWVDAYLMNGVISPASPEKSKRFRVPLATIPGSGEVKDGD